jgi:hypothetical protein
MADINIFCPYGSTAIATGAASVNVQLPGSGSVVRLFNNSTFPVFIRFGADSTVTASSSDVGIPAGGVESFSVAPNPKAMGIGIPANQAQPFIAAISPGGVGSLTITTGEGA